jgi:hypothetical protein
MPFVIPSTPSSRAPAPPGTSSATSPSTTRTGSRRPAPHRHPAHLRRHRPDRRHPAPPGRPPPPLRARVHQRHPQHRRPPDRPRRPAARRAVRDGHVQRVLRRRRGDARNVGLRRSAAEVDDRRRPVDAGDGQAPRGARAARRGRPEHSRLPGATVRAGPAGVFADGVLEHRRPALKRAGRLDVPADLPIRFNVSATPGPPPWRTSATGRRRPCSACTGWR